MPEKLILVHFYATSVSLLVKGTLEDEDRVVVVGEDGYQTGNKSHRVSIDTVQLFNQEESSHGQN